MSQIIITLDATQIREFDTCEHKWLYSYVENLRKWNSKTKPLDVGSFVHKLLETFYVLRSLNPKEDRFATQLTVINLFKKGKLGEAAGLTKDEIEFILNRFIQYVIKWTVYDFVPQKRNGVPGVELGFSKILKETKEYVFIVEGKIDLLSWTHTGGFDCFVDNKTQGRFSNLYGYKPQFKTYAWATGIRYGIINYFKVDKKYTEDETFRRKQFYYSDRMIDEWANYLETLFYRIYLVTMWHGVTSVNDLTSEWLKPNFASCGGMWESNPCYFANICEEPRQLHELIKKQYYFKVPKWTPWSIEEENNS